MADKKKQYTNIIDEILDQREPNWKELGMEDAKKSGEEQQDRTHQYVDSEFMDDIAESASRHTPILGPKSGSRLYEERIAEKEAAAPRINAVTANRRMNDYKSKDGDNDSLMDEVTESLEAAYSNSNLPENSASKKEISDAQVFKYIKDLLNQGMAPSKVAQKLEKLAEIELFNKQMSTDYLQRNAGLMGLAYLEPNSYMDKSSPTYERTASGSADCVAQKRAWDAAGVKPQAKSVKQVSACGDCTYMKKAGSTKTCTLYGLPLVANTEELTQIVNHLTAGVPTKQKHAALVAIANGDSKRVSNPKVAEQTNVVKTADAKVRNQSKRASYQFGDNRESSKRFSSEHVAKMHGKGASLEQVYKWAEEKFGSIDTSFAFRGFVQNLRKNAKGKIVVIAKDLSFLNSIGIRNADFEGKDKCASCEYHKKAFSPMVDEVDAEETVSPCVNCGGDQRHFSYDEHGEVFCKECGEVQPITPEELVQYQQSGKTSSLAPRVAQKFVSKTMDVVRNKQAEAAEVTITPAKVRALHQAGHSVQKIYNAAAAKVGSLQAKKLIVAFVEGMKKTPGKLPVNASDRAFLEGKLSFKPEQIRMLDPQRRPVTQVVASVPDDQHLLSYPGMGKHAGEKKQTDGRSILAEYDLLGAHDMQDIDTSGHKLEDVEVGDHFKVDLE